MMRKVRHRNMMSREAVDALLLKEFNVRMDGALRNLV